MVVFNFVHYHICIGFSFVMSSVAFHVLKTHLQGFPGGAVVESLPANAGGTGSSSGLGRSHMPRSN